MHTRRAQLELQGHGFRVGGGELLMLESLRRAHDDGRRLASVTLSRKGNEDGGAPSASAGDPGVEATRPSGLRRSSWGAEAIGSHEAGDWLDSTILYATMQHCTQLPHSGHPLAQG